jgi:hypothetical protein
MVFKVAMNVLGVLFDSKLNWSEEVAKAVINFYKSINAIKNIRKYFTTSKLLKLITSNYYYVLFTTQNVELT